jgi:hypothetical protein
MPKKSACKFSFSHSLVKSCVSPIFCVTYSTQFTWIPSGRALPGSSSRVPFTWLTSCFHVLILKTFGYSISKAAFISSTGPLRHCYAESYYMLDAHLFLQAQTSPYSGCSVSVVTNISSVSTRTSKRTKLLRLHYNNWNSYEARYLR